MVPLLTAELKTAETESEGRPAFQFESKDQSCPIPSQTVSGEVGVCASAGSADAAIVK